MVELDTWGIRSLHLGEQIPQWEVQGEGRGYIVGLDL